MTDRAISDIAAELDIDHTVRFNVVTEHLDAALEQLEELKAEVPAFSVEAIIFVRAEIAVVARKLANIRKALTTRVAR